MSRFGEINTDYPQLLEAENKIRLLEPFAGAKTHTKMQCLVCTHVWTATPLSKRQTFKKYGVGGCPNCNANRRQVEYSKSRQANIEQLRARGIEVLSVDYDGRRHITNDHTYTKVLVRNVLCGHTFECSPANLLANHVECAVCGPQKRAAPLTAWSKANSAKWRETASEWQKYKASVSALTTQTYKQYKTVINPHNLPRGKAGEPGAYHLDHIVPKRFCFDNNIPAEICADYRNLQMLGWRENVGVRNHIKGAIPPLFLQYLPSSTKLEQYATQLKEIFPDGQTFINIADVIVTLYDEASNRAVVVLPIDKSHADSKSGAFIQRQLSGAGVNFTILFEDELADARLLSAKLKHYAHNSAAQRIHARDCGIKECSPQEKRELLEANHVQGNDAATVSYGAYHSGNLVAVMTFCPPRVALGHKDKTKNKNKIGLWELSRFCTDVRYRIPGIASRLLAHFKRNHDWVQIYSYADRRWSIGQMYQQLGFIQTAANPPGYFYVVDGKRKHRWNYRKDVLKKTLAGYDGTLTEYQNMVNHGYWRVWDCGTLRFDITNKSSAM